MYVLFEPQDVLAPADGHCRFAVDAPRAQQRKRIRRFLKRKHFVYNRFDFARMTKRRHFIEIAYAWTTAEHANTNGPRH